MNRFFRTLTLGFAMLTGLVITCSAEGGAPPTCDPAAGCRVPKIAVVANAK